MHLMLVASTCAERFVRIWTILVQIVIPYGPALRVSGIMAAIVGADACRWMIDI
jgi:hypothetical protein